MKQKFPRSAAISVAREILAAITPFCERIILAGSLRRRKQEVGDVEILYIPMFVVEPDGLFDKHTVNLADRALDKLLLSGVISKRLNSLGSETWGDKNKLARHVATGIPIDLFSTRISTWHNYLVCRTGSAENNMRIASAAKARGWKWNPYGPGFTDHHGNCVEVTSEHDVFHLSGLPYLEPWQR
jgi:DNA polymerase/3'-5' exonuclease PolX